MKQAVTSSVAGSSELPNLRPQSIYSVNHAVTGSGTWPPVADEVDMSPTQKIFDRDADTE